MSPASCLTMYQARERHFGNLSEAQWRMLLDLAVNGECAVTSLCIGSGSPATTALAHLDWLIFEGLVERRMNEDDRRSTLVSLTTKARRLFDLFNDSGSEGAKLHRLAPPLSATFHAPSSDTIGGHDHV